MDLGVAGAVGTYYAENDTWVLSTVIERSLYLGDQLFFAGHALVITGYDDTATAVDDSVATILVCSHATPGANNGDKGDFYMSYDYFHVLGFEANKSMKSASLIDDDQDNDESDDMKMMSKLNNDTPYLRRGEFDIIFQRNSRYSWTPGYRYRSPATFYNVVRYDYI